MASNWSFLLACATLLAAHSLLVLVEAVVGPFVKTPAQMLTENGYPSEVYVVPTYDGYYLRLDRIPNPGKPAVLLPNPILSSGTIYLHIGPKYSLGYWLHRAGFDVYLASDRGTIYTQNNTHQYNSLNSPLSDKYFLFSWHEHAVIDNPAFIRKVLEVSGQSQLSYIGYSMSSCAFLGMVAMLPEYNNIIRSAHLMAPVIALGEHSSTLYRALHPTENITTFAIDTLGVHKVPDNFIRILSAALCSNNVSSALCNNIIYFVFNSARPVDYVGNGPDIPFTWPSGGSLRELLHFAQNTRYDGRFKQYDHGILENIRRYGTAIPPDYKMENIRVKTHIYRGLGDKLVSDFDAQQIAHRVPGFVGEWKHPIQGFSHADFAWDREAVTVNEKIIEDLRRYL